MTKQYRKPLTNGLLNIKVVAKRILKASRSSTVKAVEKTASWMISDHLGSIESSNMIESVQSAKFLMAKIGLMNRRDNTRYNQALVSQTSIYAIVWGWCIDHIIFVFYVLWGFVEPILTLIFITIVKVVLIVIANCIFFYGLYQLFTARYA